MKWFLVIVKQQNGYKTCHPARSSLRYETTQLWELYSWILIYEGVTWTRSYEYLLNDALNKIISSMNQA